VPDAAGHAARVDAWLKRSGKGLPPLALLRLFELAFAALWSRAEPTLGEVTLTAIAERVLHDASERFPLLSSLEVEPSSGLRCQALRAQLGSTRDAQLKGALRDVLVTFLTVLGNLTAEILTHDLHAELARVDPPGPTIKESTS
jgi:hypothetical protein